MWSLHSDIEGPRYKMPIKYGKAQSILSLYSPFSFAMQYNLRRKLRLTMLTGLTIMI